MRDDSERSDIETPHEQSTETAVPLEGEWLESVVKSYVHSPAHVDIVYGRGQGNIELEQFLDREDREFFQRARLDKQNMIPSLEWTGESLYDLANARVEACSDGEQTPQLRDLLSDEVTDARLVESFATLRVPRHLFKFLYRMLVVHCQAHTDSQPSWQINAATFEAQLALYRRDQQASDQGLIPG